MIWLIHMKTLKHKYLLGQGSLHITEWCVRKWTSETSFIHKQWLVCNNNPNKTCNTHSSSKACNQSIRRDSAHPEVLNFILCSGTLWACCLPSETTVLFYSYHYAVLRAPWSVCSENWKHCYTWVCDLWVVKMFPFKEGLWKTKNHPEYTFSNIMSDFLGL